MYWKIQEGPAVDAPASNDSCIPEQASMKASAKQELQKRYEMALELLGERNEHVDKLEDDIREMKGIFHNQLSLMADQLTGAKQLQAMSQAS